MAADAFAVTGKDSAMAEVPRTVWEPLWFLYQRIA